MGYIDGFKGGGYHKWGKMGVVVAGEGEKELDQDKALENEKKREIIAF